jgi:tRNA (cmo5U34)-methyltransferase
MDIGCSNGIAAMPFAMNFNNEMLLLDVSESMLNICRERFKDSKRIHVQNYDLRQGVPEVKSSLILSILTIQFTPIEYRKRILKSIFDSLVHGGCFIMVEKVLGNTADLDSMFVDEYYALKREHQYTNEQIESKRKSLEGVLVPITSDWNIDILHDAGFRQVDVFWRYLNFVGYIALK